MRAHLVAVFLTSLNLHSVFASSLTLFFAAFVAAQSEAARRATRGPSRMC